jgi:hypothetical protein
MVGWWVCQVRGKLAFHWVKNTYADVMQPFSVPRGFP